MCGIYAWIALTSQAKQPEDYENRIETLHKRGPNQQRIFIKGKRCIVAHTRLTINGNDIPQPFFWDDKSALLSINGEIYNSKELKQRLNTFYEFKNISDCEIILPYIYENLSNIRQALQGIDGIFSFILKHNDEYVIARDPLGITSLYYAYDNEKNSIQIASEMKAFGTINMTYNHFPPGHFMKITKGNVTIQPYYNFFAVSPLPFNTTTFRSLLESAVHKRINLCDTKWGCFLSGGLDSSIISSIAARYSKTPIRTFSIGLDGSPDLLAAKKVASYIKSNHTEFTFTTEEAIDSIPEVIHAIESYDTTTIRSSIPMYLLSKHISKLGIKMCLSGEGADECMCGYLYFHNAPNLKELEEERNKRIVELNRFDCLRAHKATLAHGIETRVPFLDLTFLQYVTNIDISYLQPTKKHMEKYILREAFQDILPREIVWRQKEQFSDGVGFSHINELEKYADKKNLKDKYSNNSVRTNEEALYLNVFEKYFSSIRFECPLLKRWEPKWVESHDPSGRIASVHLQNNTKGRLN